MSGNHGSRRKTGITGVFQFALENSLFLIIGAVAAIIWANLEIDSYHAFQHAELFTNDWIGHPHGDHKVFTLHYLVNDVLMALFFAIAGKEVWEATLPGGPLNDPKQAATPLIATIGGMAGPVGFYVAGALIVGEFSSLANGWAIPTATDIAFSYLVARLVFGAGHPAVPFLLLLAIADDALGLIILAVFYPQAELQLIWMLLPVLAIIIGLVMKRMRVRSFFPYLIIAGSISWFGFAMSGLHPALGLLPIIPTMPHAHVDTGLFDWQQLKREDTLNAFEHWAKNPVELILGAFGLLNAGVAFGAMGPATWIILAALLVGKPVGIWLCGMFAAKTLKFGLPEGMGSSDLWVLGCAAGIGFTVALFVASVAFDPGTIQSAAKMGALLSFLAAFVTILFGRVMNIEKVEGGGGGHGHH